MNNQELTKIRILHPLLISVKGAPVEIDIRFDSILILDDGTTNQANACLLLLTKAMDLHQSLCLRAYPQGTLALIPKATID